MINKMNYIKNKNYCVCILGALVPSWLIKIKHSTESLVSRASQREVTSAKVESTKVGQRNLTKSLKRYKKKLVKMI